MLICMTSAYSIEFVVVAESLYSKMDRKLIFMFVFFVAIVSCIDEQGLLTRLIAVEDGMEQCQKNNEINSVAIEENARKLNETKEIVEILQRFSKVGTSCGQLARLGFNVSDIFYLDYDGLGFGKPPFEAFCQFPEQTLIVGQEVSVDVVHCDTDFCFEHPLDYDIAEEQLEKLLEVSTTCSQSVTLNCFSSPIKVSYFYYLKSIHFIINSQIWPTLPTNFFSTCVVIIFFLFLSFCNGGIDLETIILYQI